MGYNRLMDHLNFEMDMSSEPLARLTTFALDIAGFPDVTFNPCGPGGGNPCVACTVPQDQVEKLREVLTKTFKFFGGCEPFDLIVEGDVIYLE